jgi:hypothetical protein
MNRSVTTATWLIMIGGYMSSVAMLSPELGGLGWTDGYRQSKCGDLD